MIVTTNHRTFHAWKKVGRKFKNIEEKDFRNFTSIEKLFIAMYWKISWKKKLSLKELIREQTDKLREQITVQPQRPLSECYEPETNKNISVCTRSRTSSGSHRASNFDEKTL